VSVQVFSDQPVTPRVPAFLKNTIQEALIRTNPRLSLSSAADTLIVCTITSLRITNGLEQRTRSEYQKVGSISVTDPETGAIRTEDQYGYADVPYQALVLDARMSVRCEIEEAASGVVLYSDRFDPVLTEARDVANGPNTDEQNAIYLRLAENAAALILAQICPASSSEIADLPSGKLKDASTRLERRRWAEALQLLTSMRPFERTADEAYRLYCIGVAHEALGYEATDLAEARRELQIAQTSYQRATELKPREQIFWGPKNRAEAALMRIDVLLAQARGLEAARRTGQGRTDIFQQVMNTTPGGPAVLTNDTIIQWVRSGYSDDYVKASILFAAQTSFDLSDAGQVELRRQGVSKDVVKVMSRKQQPPSNGSGTRKTVIFTIASMALSILPALLMR
jgi:hypothetical protein